MAVALILLLQLVPAVPTSASPAPANPWAWGENYYGQLGNGTTADSTTPVQVSGLTGAIAIAGGALHSLALKSDGTVWAWGWNYYGQLGVQTNKYTDIATVTPVQVTGLTGAVAIAADNAYSLALKSDGTVWAWGNNSFGQLGNGSTGGISPTPVQVTGLTGAVAIAAGGNHGLAVKSDGTVWAWGYNSTGQLGNGNAGGSVTQVQVSSLTGAVAVAWDKTAYSSDGAETLLQFASAGHVLGFAESSVIIASASHMLRTEFINANAVAPEEDGNSAGDAAAMAPPLRRVTYHNLWDGVTLVYEASPGSIVKSSYHPVNRGSVNRFKFELDSGRLSPKR